MCWNGPAWFRDEGPNRAGNLDPTFSLSAQSSIEDYAHELLEKGHAYYAFDTAADIEAMRASRAKQAGNAFAKYNFEIRMQMRNSLSMIGC